MSRSLPPFIVQILGAVALLVGLYLALRGRPGAGQIMLVGAGLLTGPTAVRVVRDRYATLPPPEQDELEQYRRERDRRREVREEKRRDSDDEW